MKFSKLAKPRELREPIRKGSRDANTWWPRELGTPSVLGVTSGIRYGYFADKNRLVIDDGKHVKVYDTDGKAISCFSTRDGESLMLETDEGPRRLSSLRLLSVMA